jgi:hypothetical protein
MRVVDSSIAILGGSDVTGGAESVGPDSPVLRVEGICVLGGVEIRRKARKGDKGSVGRSLGGRRDLMLEGVMVEDVIGRALQTRHEVHHLMRERRRAVREQIREQRRDLGHGTWTSSDDE